MYPVSYGWLESDISATAPRVRAGGAGIARFGEENSPAPLSRFNPRIVSGIGENIDNSSTPGATQRGNQPPKRYLQGET